jgi:uncharacterized membrane protein (UPF0127 family)
VAGAVQIAHSLKARLIGLLRTPALGSDAGLWLAPCTSVHTFFMRYPIDVVFLDAERRVLTIATLAPWRFSRWIPKAHGVLELAAGQAQKAQIQIGDQLVFKEHS